MCVVASAPARSPFRRLVTEIRPVAKSCQGDGQLSIDSRIGDHRLVEHDAAERQRGEVHAPGLQRLVDRVEHGDPGKDVNVLNPV